MQGGTTEKLDGLWTREVLLSRGSPLMRTPQRWDAWRDQHHSLFQDLATRDPRDWLEACRIAEAVYSTQGLQAQPHAPTVRKALALLKPDPPHALTTGMRAKGLALLGEDQAVLQLPTPAPGLDELHLEGIMHLQEARGTARLRLGDALTAYGHYTEALVLARLLRMQRREKVLEMEIAHAVRVGNLAPPSGAVLRGVRTTDPALRARIEAARVRDVLAQFDTSGAELLIRDGAPPRLRALVAAFTRLRDKEYGPALVALREYTRDAGRSHADARVVRAVLTLELTARTGAAPLDPNEMIRDAIEWETKCLDPIDLIGTLALVAPTAIKVVSLVEDSWWRHVVRVPVIRPDGVYVAREKQPKTPESRAGRHAKILHSLERGARLEPCALDLVDPDVRKRLKYLYSGGRALPGIEWCSQITDAGAISVLLKLAAGAGSVGAERWLGKARSLLAGVEGALELLERV